MISNFKKGFTLIEVLASVVLLALAIAAIVMSNAAFTQATSHTVQISTAQYLIEQISELTAILPMRDPVLGIAVFGPEPGETGIALYDDVDDFDGAVFSPPIDSQRRQLANFSNYSQVVTVQNVSATNFQQTVADHSSDFIRVTVRIFYKNSEISNMSWIRSLR